LLKPLSKLMKLLIEYRRTSNMLVLNTCIDQIACVLSVCLCFH